MKRIAFVSHFFFLICVARFLGTGFFLGKAQERL